MSGVRPGRSYLLLINHAQDNNTSCTVEVAPQFPNTESLSEYSQVCLTPIHPGVIRPLTPLVYGPAITILEVKQTYLLTVTPQNRCELPWIRNVITCSFLILTSKCLLFSQQNFFVLMMYNLNKTVRGVSK